MSKEKAPDYSGFPITKLPPGRAAGAGDLKKWSNNRSLGRSGVGSGSEQQKVVRCKRCEKDAFIFVAQKMRLIEKYRCRHCGWVSEARARKVGKR
jgi:ribosomal protein L37E